MLQGFFSCQRSNIILFSIISAPSNKIRASDKQTKSQQEALQRLKNKSLVGRSTSQNGVSKRYGGGNGSGNYDSHHNQRKVVNYANKNDFPDESTS